MTTNDFKNFMGCFFEKTLKNTKIEIDESRKEYRADIPVINQYGHTENIKLGLKCDTNSSFNMTLEMMGHKMEMKSNYNEKTMDVDISGPNDLFNGSYEDDLDIIHIHRYIINYLTNNKSKDKIKKTIELNNELEKIKRPQKLINRNNTLKNIKILKQEINDIENKEDYNKYINESKNILDEYNKLGPVIKRKKFINVSEKDNEDDEDEYRNSLIDRYLSIASNYIDINIYKDNKIDNKLCPICNIKMDKSISMVNDGMMVCPECNLEKQIYVSSFDYENCDMDTSNAKTNDIINYFRRIDEFEAKEPSIYPSNIEEILDNYFIKNNLPTCAEVRIIPLNKDGRTRGNTSKKLMKNVLKNLRKELPKMYNNIEWICVKFLGWTRHDLSDYRGKLEKIFDMIQKIIDENKGSRRSNINRDYRLYRELERFKYPYLNINDFHIVREDSLDYHENMLFNHVIPESGWDKDPNYKPRKMIDILLEN